MSAERAPESLPSSDNRIYLVVGQPGVPPAIRPYWYERARVSWLVLRERVHETWLGEVMMPLFMLGVFIGSTLLGVEFIRLAYTWKTEAGIDLFPGLSGRDIFPFLND